MTTTECFIENAIKASESIKIKYNGGSQPGRIREIIPTKLTGNKVFAFCITSGANKSFIIDKIELVDTTTTTEYDPNFIHEPEFKEEEGLQPIYDKFINTWLEYGWHVEIGENGIHLFCKWKNGNPLKHSSVCIEFVEELYDYSEFLDHGKKNEKPWLVRGNGGAYYKYFEKAVEKFIEKSKTVSPISRRK